MVTANAEEQPSNGKEMLEIHLLYSSSPRSLSIAVYLCAYDMVALAQELPIDDMLPFVQQAMSLATKLYSVRPPDMRYRNDKYREEANFWDSTCSYALGMGPTRHSRGGRIIDCKDDPDNTYGPLLADICKTVVAEVDRCEGRAKWWRDHHAHTETNIPRLELNTFNDFACVLEDIHARRVPSSARICIDPELLRMAGIITQAPRGPFSTANKSRSEEKFIIVNNVSRLGRVPEEILIGTFITASVISMLSSEEFNARLRTEWKLQNGRRRRGKIKPELHSMDIRVEKDPNVEIACFDFNSSGAVKNAQKKHEVLKNVIQRVWPRFPEKEGKAVPENCRHAYANSWESDAKYGMNCAVCTANKAFGPV